MAEHATVAHKESMKAKADLDEDQVKKIKEKKEKKVKNVKKKFDEIFVWFVWSVTLVTNQDVIRGVFKLEK